MDDTGESSALDVSEDALVVDLSRCNTDDSQLMETSADSNTVADDGSSEEDISVGTESVMFQENLTGESVTEDNTKETRAVKLQSGCFSGTNIIPQEDPKCCDSRSLPSNELPLNEDEQGRSQSVNWMLPSKYSSEKSDQDVNGILPSKYTPQKVVEDKHKISSNKFNPQKLPESKHEIWPSKYTPQKVDHKLAQLAVNAYVSPRNSEKGKDQPVIEPEMKEAEKQNEGEMISPTIAFVSTECSNSLQLSSDKNQYGNECIQKYEKSISKPVETISTDSENNVCIQELGECKELSVCEDKMSLDEENITTDNSMKNLSCEVNNELDINGKDTDKMMKTIDDGDHDDEIDENSDIHCVLCDNWFDHMISYNQHLPKHSNSASSFHGSQCELCDKKFLYEMDFKRHVQSHLEPQKIFKCRVCFKPFTDKNHLQYHLRIHQDKKEFPCHYCGKEFHYSFNLKKHLRTHTGEKPYTCVICEQKFTHKNSLNRHMTVHTDDTDFVCCVCNKQLDDRWCLQKHLASHQILNCGHYKCELSFSTLRQLQEHQHSHMNDQLQENEKENREENTSVHLEMENKPKVKRIRKSQDMQCKICRKIFKNAGNYYRHLQAKEGMPVETCDLCGHQFHDVYNLLKHTRQVHSQGSEKSGYPCRVCGQNYSDLSTLTEHMSEHLQTMKSQEENPANGQVYPSAPAFGNVAACFLCGQSFPNRTVLDLHRMEHHSGIGMETALDLSKSSKKKESTQPPPRKRLKMEAIDVQPYEYYDSDKENEPLNLSKKKYSPMPGASVLGVLQPHNVQKKSSENLSSSCIAVSDNDDLGTKQCNSSNIAYTTTVGLDLSCKKDLSSVTSARQNSPDGSAKVSFQHTDSYRQGNEQNEKNFPAQDHQNSENSVLQAQSSSLTETKVKNDSRDYLHTDKTEQGHSLDSNSSLVMDTNKIDSLDQSYNMAVTSQLQDENSNMTDPSSRTGSPDSDMFDSLTCEYCAKAFNNPLSLNRHLSSHYKEWAFCCNNCNTMFTEESSYKSHLPSHPSHTPYMCNICLTHFTDRISLGAHMSQNHPQEKPYQCGVCQRRFPVKSYLGSHCRTHVTERPFKCTICNRAFVHNFNLTKHMRTHTGEKPYSCRWCDRKFSQKNSLNRHENIHKRETPSKGQLCPAGNATGQLFSPGPTDTQHANADRATPQTPNIPSPAVTPVRHRSEQTNSRSRNSSASSTSTHKTSPEGSTEGFHSSIPPEMMQHMYMQQMAMMQHMTQQGGNLQMLQNPYMMAAYMQQIQFMQHVHAAQDPNFTPYPPDVMSNYFKSMENFNRNLQRDSPATPESQEKL